MRDAYRLRYRLIPYIYTAARHTYDDAVALVRPLYWDWPEQEDAYRFDGEYAFGPDMVVSPVVQPIDSASLLAADTLWVPPGDWIEWSTGARLHGPAVFGRAYALDELPVLVRAGAIVPMQPDMLRSDARPVDPLILTVFPGDSGATRVYEDAGNTQGYRDGRFSWTPVRQHTTRADATGGPAAAGTTLHLDIAPVERSFPGMLQRRAYEVRLPGTLPPTRVHWQGNDASYDAECARRAAPLPAMPSAAEPSATAPDTGAAARAPAPACWWSYDGQTLTTTIRLPAENVRAAKRLVVDLPPTDESLLDGTPGLLARMHRTATLLERTWPDDWPPDAFMDLVQAGRRITLHTDSAAAELSRLQERLPAVLEKVRAMKGDSTIIAQALAHLGAQRH
ncbi:MAG: glycoside hydrolase family 31 protein [Gemmatimonadota bacterium]